MAIVIVWSIAIACGLAVWVVDRRSANRLKAAADWPSAQGRVVAAETVRRYHGRWSPRVTYAWVVDGRGYAGDRMQFGGAPHFTDPDQAIVALGDHETGAPITVRYDPHRPGSAVLKVESLDEGLVVLGLVTAAMVVTAILVTIVELTR